MYYVKANKFRKQIFQIEFLPKKEPTNLFFYPDYLSGEKNKFDGLTGFGWKICFRFLLTFVRFFESIF